MWLITNLETEEELLFKSVDEWQSYVHYNKWTDYTIRFIHIGITA